MKQLLSISFFLLLSITLLAQSPSRFYDKGLAGYKNPVTGEIIVPATYQAGSDFQEGFAIVMQNNLLGYINEQGLLVIPCRFNDAGLFVNGLAMAAIGNAYGFINTKGEWAIANKYDFADSFSEGYA